MSSGFPRFPTRLLIMFPIQVSMDASPGNLLFYIVHVSWKHAGHVRFGQVAAYIAIAIGIHFEKVKHG